MQAAQSARHRDKPASSVAWIAAVWLGGQAPACEHGDIILGTGGAPAPVHSRDAGGHKPERSASTSGTPAPTTDAAADYKPDSSVALSASDAGSPMRLLATDRASAGCGTTAAALTTSTFVAGVRAEFLLDLPAAYDNTRAYSLVLAFRGTSVTAERFREQLDLAAATDDEAIRVHANPVGDSAGWDFQRDMFLVDQLISDLAAAYCIDLNRVFAVGDGSGALFANLVGCVRADKVRGIALLASAPPPPGPCIGNPAVWLLQQIDANPMIANAGLGNRDFWASRNACSPVPPESSSTGACGDYAGCAPKSPVRYCEHTGDTPPALAVTGAWQFFDAL